MYNPSSTRDFNNIYQLEATQVLPLDSAFSFKKLLWLLLKASGIFLVITIIVFAVVNYQFIKAQIIDARSGRKYNNYVADIDDDKLPDWWEQENGLNSNDAGDAQLDSDNDGLNNFLEFQFGVNPNDPDSDGDGYFDGEEIRKGYNPNGTGRIDSDGDGLYDWWEIKNGLNKDDPADAKEDDDQDDLSNKEEFLQGTDPHNRDSDGDGKGDGQEVKNGQNPLGDGPLSESFKNISLNDQDRDGLNLEKELFFGTDPEKADSDGDNFNDYRELSRGYDPLGEGFIKATLEIPAIKVEAPITWSQKVEEKNILKELEEGLVHYPGSTFPGFLGNNYITGHSSYYAWSDTSYGDVLKHLNKLKIGDEIIFHLEFANGQKKRIIYKVTAPGEVVLPYDRRIFQDIEKYETTLVTCWPIGTNWKRMMVKAELETPVWKQN